MAFLRIFAFGDSITYGAHDSEMGGWVDRLKLWANEKNASGCDRIAVFNLGIPGTTSADGLKRFQRETQVRLDQYDKTFFIFAFGTNDVGILPDGKYLIDKKTFSKNMKKLSEQAREFNGQPILLTLPPVIEEIINNPQYVHKQRFNKDIADYNQVIREITQQENIELIDIAQAFENENWKDLISVDGLHPNSVGHERIFERVKAFFETQLTNC